MKDKEKQIEEMAMICCGSKITCSECFEEYKKVMNIKIKKKSEHCQAYNYAETLYNAGYRKIEDHEIVISMDEYERLNDTVNMRKVRKETAKEIFKAIKKLVDETDHIFDSCEMYTWDPDVGYDKEQIDNGLNELAKQFGVEVKE